MALEMTNSLWIRLRFGDQHCDSAFESNFDSPLHWKLKIEHIIELFFRIFGELIIWFFGELIIWTTNVNIGRMKIELIT